MKKRIPILIVLAAVIAGGLYFYPRLKEKPTASNQLVVSGNIEAHESLLSFKVAGRIVELPVQEGQWVEASTVLAKLDNADYRQKVNIDEANVRVRESNLALTTAGSRPQEIKAAEQSVADATAEVEQRKLDLERAERLFSRDAVAAQDRDRGLDANRSVRRGRSS